MPGSIILKFADPEGFEQNVRASDIRETVTACGIYDAQLTKIDLHRLWMQRFRKALPGITYDAVHEGRVSIYFLAGMDHQPLLNNGIMIRPGEVVCDAPGTEHYLRTQADFHCAGMSLAPEDFAKYGRALAGHELAAPTATRVVRPSSSSMVRLMHLHNAASDLAMNAPDILTRPEVAKVMEEALVRAMITCLTEGETASRVGEERRPVMRWFERVLEAREGELLYLTDICAEIGVSDRSLRRHCQERLGMGPHQYLWLRRMNMARRALSRGDFARTTVTAIALDHGFGELGRFSVHYRRLFGESPSETLRRTADEPSLIAMNATEERVGLADFAIGEPF
jgi:AraC-like DNA-binding protein